MNQKRYRLTWHKKFLSHSQPALWALCALLLLCGAVPCALADAQTAAPSLNSTLAYINGRAVTGEQLLEPLLEVAGEPVLRQLVLDRAVAQRIKSRGLKLTDQQIQAEKQRVLTSFSSDSDTAVRLLSKLAQRGLGETRFKALLRRNAGLRLLVNQKVNITPVALHQAYQLQYAMRYQAQIIVTDSLEKAQSLLHQIKQGASFTELAITDSTDRSSVRGGLLAPISPADAHYPKAIRTALTKLKSGTVSPIIAVNHSFALLKLVRIVPAKKVAFDQVQKKLSGQVRSHVIQMRMRKLARRLIQQAKVTVVDPALAEQWKHQQP